MILKYISCCRCKKDIPKDFKFCSYCGEEIIMVDAWLDCIIKMVINTVNNSSAESEMLKEMGFNDKISERMKLEMLIWRMFITNLVIQEKSKELNDPFHNTILLKIYKQKKEIDNILALVHDRYKEYYNHINSGNDIKILYLSMTYLDYFINGKITSFSKYSDKEKLFSVSYAIVEDFAKFMNFTRMNIFNNKFVQAETINWR